MIPRHTRVLPTGEGRGSGERGERQFMCCSFVGVLCFASVIQNPQPRPAISSFYGLF